MLGLYDWSWRRRWRRRQATSKFRRTLSRSPLVTSLSVAGTHVGSGLGVMDLRAPGVRRSTVHQPLIDCVVSERLQIPVGDSELRFFPSVNLFAFSCADTISERKQGAQDKFLPHPTRPPSHLLVVRSAWKSSSGTTRLLLYRQVDASVGRLCWIHSSMMVLQ